MPNRIRPITQNTNPLENVNIPQNLRNEHRQETNSIPEEKETSLPYVETRKLPYVEPRQLPKFNTPNNIPDNVEDNFARSKDKQNKKGLFLKISIVVVILAILGAGTYFFKTLYLNKQNTPLQKMTDSSQKQIATNKLSDKVPTFDGKPTPVKWPADVKPTRMDIQLDPSSGQPVLLLTGDKAGLGTVIRSYNTTGTLTGFWVIVPDTQADVSTTPSQTTPAPTTLAPTTPAPATPAPATPAPATKKQ